MKNLYNYVGYSIGYNGIIRHSVNHGTTEYHGIVTKILETSNFVVVVAKCTDGQTHLFQFM
jgi:hypothetical protein